MSDMFALVPVADIHVVYNPRQHFDLAPLEEGKVEAGSAGS